MKKGVLLTVILSVSALIVGIAGTVAVMVFGIYGPKLTKAENEIDSLSTSLTDTQGQLSTLQEQHNTLKSENDTLKTTHESLKADHSKLEADHTKLEADHTKLKADYEKIAGDIVAKKAEVDKLKKEAAQAEKDLAQAKKGVQSLTKVAKLFESYDQQCNELAELLVDYANALNENNVALASKKYQEYMTKATIADNTYKEISDLLEQFRKENNL